MESTKARGAKRKIEGRKNEIKSKEAQFFSLCFSTPSYYFAGSSGGAISEGGRAVKEVPASVESGDRGRFAILFATSIRDCL